jgi:hypothetical protein
MGGRESGVKDCLQQSKMVDLSENFFRNVDEFYVNVG